MKVLKLEFVSFYQYWQLITEHKIKSLATETNILWSSCFSLWNIACLLVFALTCDALLPK